MSGARDTVYETVIKVEDEEFFIDLNNNNYGLNVKISAKARGSRASVRIPLSAIPQLTAALKEAEKAGKNVPKSAIGAPAEKSERRERKVREPVEKVPENPETIARSVFVTDVAREAVEEDLLRHFKQAGTILNVTLNLRSGRRGSALVEFRSPAESKRAVELFDGSTLFDRQIKVRQDRPLADRPVDYTARDAERAVRDAKQATEKAERSSRRRDATKPESDEPREPRVRRERKPREPRAEGPVDPKRVWITNLSYDTTVESLKKAFSAAGRITNGEIQISNRTGRSSGQGWLEFARESDVIDAIARYQGFELDGRAVVTRAYVILPERA